MADVIIYGLQQQSERLQMVVWNHSILFVKRSWLGAYALYPKDAMKWIRKKNKPVQMVKRLHFPFDSLLIQCDTVCLFKPHADTNTSIQKMGHEGGQMQTFQTSIHFHAWLVECSCDNYIQAFSYHWHFHVLFTWNQFKLCQFESAVWKQ